MANTAERLVGNKTRYVRVDTNSTVLYLGHANPRTTGQMTIHVYSNSALGNGITVSKIQAGADSVVGVTSIACDYQKDSTDTAAGTKVTTNAILYVRCDHSEQVQLSFEITSGSWDVFWSGGAG